jgi:hypothetical protein
VAARLFAWRGAGGPRGIGPSIHGDDVTVGCDGDTTVLRTKLGRWKGMACGDGDFQQQWQRDLEMRWRHRVSPEMGMGR